MPVTHLPKTRTKEEMTREIDRHGGPVCKFGPGGDFVTVWQPRPSKSSGPSNYLVKLLTSTVEMVVILLGLERSSPSVCSKSARYCSECIVRQKEEVRNAVRNKKVHDTIEPAATTVAEADRSFSREPMLFPNDNGIGIRIKHKPKHRVRTYRRTAKKRLALVPSEQGSLFETDFKGARTA